MSDDYPISIYGTESLRRVKVSDIFLDVKKSIQVVRECFIFGLRNNDNPLLYLIERDTRSKKEKRQSIAYLYAFRRLMISPALKGTRDVFNAITAFFGEWHKDTAPYLWSLDLDRERIQRYLSVYPNTPSNKQDLRKTMYYTCLVWLISSKSYSMHPAESFIKFEQWLDTVDGTDTNKYWQTGYIYEQIVGKREVIPHTEVTDAYLKWRREKPLHTQGEAREFVNKWQANKIENMRITSALEAMYDIAHL